MPFSPLSLKKGGGLNEKGVIDALSVQSLATLPYFLVSKLGNNIRFMCNSIFTSIQWQKHQHLINTKFSITCSF